MSVLGGPPSLPLLLQRELAKGYDLQLKMLFYEDLANVQKLDFKLYPDKRGHPPA